MHLHIENIERNAADYKVIPNMYAMSNIEANIYFPSHDFNHIDEFSLLKSANDETSSDIENVFAIRLGPICF